MKPILFNENETSFTSNGIGRLSDATECKVREVKNGQYTLTMSYPVQGRWFNELKVGRIIYALHDNTGLPQPFDIVSVSKPSKGYVKVNANHISYRLSGIVASPFGVVNLTAIDYLTGLASAIIGTCPFTFTSDVDDVYGTIVSTMDNAKPASVRALLGSDARTNFVEIFGVNGAAFKWDKFTVSFLKNRGQDNGVSFRRGKNVIQLSQDVDNSQFVTAVVPFWRGYDPVTGDQVQVDLSDQGWVVKSAIADSYPYQHTAVYDMSDVWEQPPLKQELIAGAQQYLQILTYNQFHKRTSYAVDLTYTGTETDALQDVNLCDTVKLIDEVLDVATSLEVVETVYDCLRERYSSIGVGDHAQTFSEVLKLQNKIYIETIKSQQEQTSDLAKKTNVTRYVVPASANTNANVQTRGATRAAATPEYDSDGNEIEKIATINRQDIYAHVGGGGGGSGAKVLTIPKNTSLMNSHTSVTPKAIIQSGSNVVGATLTLTALTTPTLVDQKFYIPDTGNTRLLSIYGQATGRLSNGDNISHRCILNLFCSVNANGTQLDIQGIDSIEIQRGTMGLVLAGLYEVGTNFNISCTYA